ncbi:MAG: cyclic lactone autoinducer peptide [Velocimicrobium sp.]
MKNKGFCKTSAFLLNKVAVAFSSAPCNGHLHEPKVPKELSKKK